MPARASWTTSSRGVSHPSEAVMTNVLGTWTLAQVAADHRCRLVHISTDKAVDPCSIMGASKRVAELAVLSMGNEHALPFSLPAVTVIQAPNDAIRALLFLDPGMGGTAPLRDQHAAAGGHAELH